MRIIGGSLGGRTFQSPKGHRTHPMSERTRGAIFNQLGDIRDLTVLDCFAGSGALSLEALSRGARHATAIDKDRQAHAVIVQNAHELGLNERLKAIQAGLSSWSDNNSDQQFDLIFCDPPYDQTQASLIQNLTKHLAPNGLFLVSWPGKQSAPELVGLEQVIAKNYGDNQLIIYRNR